MGDSYHPGYAGPYDRTYDRYDDRAPPRDRGAYYRSQYDDHYSRSYPPRDRDDYHYPRPREPPRPSARDEQYTFRGAADRYPPPRPPQGQFTFESHHPSAPRFPPAAPSAQSSSRRHDDRKRDGRRPPGPRGRGGFGPRGRGGRPAHTRDILSKAGREPTPELLEGMNADGQERFHEVESDSEADDDHSVIDLTRSDPLDEPRNKRQKVEEPEQAPAPKWSNPDPYTALPPPETLGAPKKDIVQVIRKAKNDAANKADGAKDSATQNADFISFNDMGDEDMSDASESSREEQPPAHAPKAPRGFSHRDSFHAHLSNQPIAINGQPPVPAQASNANRGPPSPPPGFVMPTDQELMEQYVGGGTSKKRKQPKVKADSAFNVVEEWEENGTDPTPWCKVDHSRTANTGLRLHKEICDFFDFVKPYDYEETVRRDLIRRVESEARRSGIPNCSSVSIECFGSFAAGLYLPTADMDLVAVSPAYRSYGKKTFGQTNTQMHRLSKALQFGGVAAPAGVAVITRARVPIIKFADKLSGIKVDISFENDSGLKANKTFRQWKAQFPAMPIIVVLVKQLLAMHGLNEVYTGGIGGFTIICLVVSMMQLMPELQSGSMNQQMHYGDLLLNFLDLYGNKFDFQRTGITLDPPGYFDKISNPRAKANPKRMTIIDPNNADNDISGGSARIEDVLDLFRHAYEQLQGRLAQLHRGQNLKDSILGCIWGGNYSSFIHQREKLSLLQRGYRVSPPPPPAPKPASKSKGKAQQDKSRKRQKPNGDDNSAKQQQQPARGGRQPMMHHPLPPRPAPSQPPAANRRAPEPSTAADSAEQTQATKPPKKAARRAKQFKAQFPNVQVPKALSLSDLRRLCAKNGIKEEDFDRNQKLGP